MPASVFLHAFASQRSPSERCPPPFSYIPTLSAWKHPNALRVEGARFPTSQRSPRGRCPLSYIPTLSAWKVPAYIPTLFAWKVPAFVKADRTPNPSMTVIMAATNRFAVPFFSAAFINAVRLCNRTGLLMVDRIRTFAPAFFHFFTIRE